MEKHIKLLILDIDETLVFATRKPLDREADFKTELYHVYKRPYLDEFLEFCRIHFEVGIWTTGGDEYAEDVQKSLFSDGYPLSFTWSSERCTRKFDQVMFHPYYIKDLKKLKKKGYRLEEIIMVDNTPRKLEKNYGNLVAIKDWEGDPEDRELLRLINYLTYLKDVENVRAVEKRFWAKQYEV